ncbi:hypothetical protein CP533_6161 [Ophiocordyceps camponoti-saundersi (nom. inval.)]|nr:hypothetical protein CP533_6161 [Ophiocordyceps camponoti-saundersi (nom. inval.)]
MKATLAILATLAGTAITAPTTESTPSQQQPPDTCPDNQSCIEFCLDKKVVSSDRKVDFGSCYVQEERVYCTQFNATDYRKMKVQGFDCTSENLVSPTSSETNPIGSSSHNVSNHRTAERTLSRPVRSTDDTINEEAKKPQQLPQKYRETQQEAMNELKGYYKKVAESEAKRIPCNKKTFICKVKINASSLRDLHLGCNHHVGVFGYGRCMLKMKDLARVGTKGVKKE